MLRLFTLSLTSALMFAVMAPSTAEAAGKKKKGGPEAIFKKLDTDGDGKISKTEFAKLGEVAKKAGKGGKAGKGDKLFSKLDTNGDGSLSLEEFKKLGEQKKKKSK